MDIEKYISYQIQTQFPAIYQETGEELVSLVKSYYDFLEGDIEGFYVSWCSLSSDSDRQYFSEKYSSSKLANERADILREIIDVSDVTVATIHPQSTYHNRRLFEYRDIDRTLSEMLLFYKNKYLADLPLESIDIRFVVKHIMDLYRRKGTPEGIKLFFRLFYMSNNVSIKYPSEDILRPSSSKWVVRQYIEMFPRDQLLNAKDVLVRGSISGATATIDKVNYIIISNTLVPVIEISDVKGTFVRYDVISTINGEILGISKGSLNEVTITVEDQRSGTYQNKIGEVVNITSSTGFGGQANITKVSTEISGAVDFYITDGGFGYTIDAVLTLSEQVIYVNGSPSYSHLEPVMQSSSGATGRVVGFFRTSSNITYVGVIVDGGIPFTTGGSLTTVYRPTNISSAVILASERNTSASVDVGLPLGNEQTLTNISDIIGDYLLVSLDSVNYSASPAITPMSGTSPVTLTTPLSIAFDMGDITIGSIENLININPGIGYTNDIFVAATDPHISPLRIPSQTIYVDDFNTSSLIVGDIITQYDPAGLPLNEDIRAKVISKTTNNVTVSQLTLKGIIPGNVKIERTHTSIAVSSVVKNYGYDILGENALIGGLVSGNVGSVQQVSVIDSGIGFVRNDRVSMTNQTKIEEAAKQLDAVKLNPNSLPEDIEAAEANLEFWRTNIVAVGTGDALLHGKAAGVWITTSGHLNSTKVIQDSDFYQDFSYQITSDINPNTYSGPLHDIMHVAGTKVFHRFSKECNIELSSSVDIEFVAPTIV